MKAGKYPVDQETWLIKAVREVLPPSMKLMVDANCGMKSFHETKELMKHLEHMEVTWLEEPFAPNAYEMYEELCKTNPKIPIAAGENAENLDEFKRLIDAGVSIIQPELSRCGGFELVPDLINLAKQHNVSLTPHVWGSGVLYSAALQFYSLLDQEDPLLFECPFVKDPIRDDCFYNFRVDGGMIHCPQKPGLGVEINEELFDRFLVNHI